MSSKTTLAGYADGRIKVVSKVFPAKSPELWWCQCSCGTWKAAPAKWIKRKNAKLAKSCGCAKRENAKKLATNLNAVDLAGKTFGRWRVIGLDTRKNSSCRYWMCVCACGTRRPVASQSLLQQRSISCGCYQREIAPELALHMSKKRRSNKTLLECSRTALTKSLRYARQKDATPPWVSRKELRRIYENCPTGYHVDHIHPIKHPQLCGLHVPWNLQYLPAEDNLRKRNYVEI